MVTFLFPVLCDVPAQLVTVHLIGFEHLLAQMQQQDAAADRRLQHGAEDRPDAGDARSFLEQGSGWDSDEGRGGGFPDGSAGGGPHHTVTDSYHVGSEKVAGRGQRRWRR